MRRLLNQHTGTVHKSSGETSGDEAVCGALQHVPQRHVTSVSTGKPRSGGGTRTDDERTGVGEEVQRCGRCFEEAGGY